MLFWGLLIYLVLLPTMYWLLVPLIPALQDLPDLVWMSALFLVSVLLAVFGAFLTNVYNPSGKQQARDLVRTTGVRWLAGLTAAVIVVGLGMQLLYFETVPEAVVLGFVLPALCVSGLNALGIELPLKRLEAAPVPGHVVLPEAPELPETGQEMIRSYRWVFEGAEYAIRLVIRRAAYDDFKGRPRVPDARRWAAEYVIGGLAGEIRELAHQLYQVGIPYGTYREVTFVLSFVQQAIAYQHEEGEYPKYPVETLADTVGDCEDYAILGAALLKHMGYEAALLFVPGHAALGVAGAEDMPGTYVEHNGVPYYYCEMTGAGWQIGEVPEQYGVADVEVSPIPPLPTKVVLQENR